jgi:hypothetical protein
MRAKHDHMKQEEAGQSPLRAQPALGHQKAKAEIRHSIAQTFGAAWLESYRSDPT